MKQCTEKEGYLLMYSSDGDEIHISLVSQEHYDAILKEINFPDEMDRVAFETDSLHDWFSQTQCNEDWPFKNVKILGTIHIWGA